MDKLIYTTLSGARQTLERQATVTNNLANASTPGFRAQIDAFKEVKAQGEGIATRSFVSDATVGADFTPGTMQQTGRALDVAIQGKGWLAVQTADGNEAYTRSGSLKIDENGLLQTQSGLNIVGDGGPISIPPNLTVTIGKDGTVSGSLGNGVAGQTVIGKIKLVNPPEDTLERRGDGLFTIRGNGQAEPDQSVSLAEGALEGSNVNVVEGMVSMISLARSFDMQMKMIQNAEQNDAKAAQIMSLS